MVKVCLLPSFLKICLIRNIEFTDAIAEDWGGKPFVDMQKGWKYALNVYPEVDLFHVGIYWEADLKNRLMLIEQSQLGLVGADMP